MLGIRADGERGEHRYLEFVGRDSFYGFLALHRGELFRDEDFAALYCLGIGRPSVSPSLLATALLLQTYEGASDEEAKQRADFDLRWKVALGIHIEERPKASSTLQLFRAHLILHDQARAVFQRGLGFARQTGYFRSRKLRLVLDTSHILGRGAVKDTYNLLADGIIQLVRPLAALACSEREEWAREHGLTRYFGSILKGEAGIDWDEPRARQAFLGSIVADADRLLGVAREILEATTVDEQHQGLQEATGLLGRLLQDIERQAEGVGLKQGVSPDRVVSVHDPEMRHGRKSATRRFDGHMAAVAVDAESELITAVDVLPGNAQDHERALELVEQAQVNTDAEVEETVGDCAYGDTDTRRTFANAGKRLVARVMIRRGQAQFPKEDFRIDLEALTCTCPAGQESHKVISISSGERYGAPGFPLRAFRFDAALCDVCPLRPKCVRARLGKGRLVMLHPEEELLQEARAFQQSEAFAPYRKLRQVAEHRLARLMQLGMRQARYFGRTKTLFQLLMAATVANLTLVATRTGLMRSRYPRRAQLSGDSLVLLRALSALASLFALAITNRTPTFRPEFQSQVRPSRPRCALGSPPRRPSSLAPDPCPPAPPWSARCR